MRRTETYTLPPAHRRSAGVNSGVGTSVEWLIVYPAIFLIPALMFIEIRIVGRLFLSELLMAGTLPFFLLYRGRTLWEPLPRTFLFLAFLWLVSQVGTDLYRGTPFQDFTRGWAKITTTMINFMVIYMMTYGSRRRLNVFALGITAGYFLVYMFNPSEQLEEDPWKFGLGLAVTLLFCNIASLRQVYRTGVLPALCLLVPAGLSLMQASRSLAGISFLAAVFVFFQSYISGRRKRARKMSLGKITLLVGTGIAAAVVLMQVYTYAAKEGLLGREAQYKYELQSGGQFGILLGGRAEAYVSLQAISASPIIGHGSWAKDPRYAALLLKLENYGYDISSQAVESDLIPSHSHLFGAWVEAGIVGAVFWTWVLFLIAWVLIKLAFVKEPLTPLAAFTGLLLAWDVLFSPFGAERRIIIPFFLIILMAASKAADGWRSESGARRVAEGETPLQGRGWWGKFLRR